MITCKNCNEMHVICTMQAFGQNLHTKLNSKKTLVVTPEYYRISDEGENPKIGCSCGNTEYMLACDYCGNFLNGDTVRIVTEGKGKYLISCKRHKDFPKSFKIEEVKISSLNIKPKT